MYTPVILERDVSKATERPVVTQGAENLFRKCTLTHLFAPVLAQFFRSSAQQWLRHSTCHRFEHQISKWSRHPGSPSTRARPLASHCKGAVETHFVFS